MQKPALLSFCFKTQVFRKLIYFNVQFSLPINLRRAAERV